MNKAAYPNLFKPLTVDGLKLKNRLTMAPLYLGYAGPGGKVSPLLLAHYQRMAQSGVALVIVENSSITPAGSGSVRTLRCDHNRYLTGLESLAGSIKAEGSLAGLQINHAGRFAHVAEPLAPSAVSVFGKTPRALSRKEIRLVQKQYARAALRVQRAGFDMVELHGGTGYLLAEFVSPRTNQRTDLYGGTIESRIKFSVEVLKEVRDAVGNFPVGYRFLADEWLPDGLHLEESKIVAGALAENGVAYLSVMGGTYESFVLPEIVKRSRQPGYMTSLAAAIKKAVHIPVITAGRISTPALAESIIRDKKADLIGLARMLWVDPQWPNKAREGRDKAIIKCSPKCDACLQRVMSGQPAFCPRWNRETRAQYKALFK